MASHVPEPRRASGSWPPCFWSSRSYVSYRHSGTLHLMKLMSKQSFGTVAALILALGLSFFLGRESIETRRGAILREKGFKYISPIIGCEIAPDEKDFEEFAFLEKNIQQEVHTVEEEKRASSISVYFRALNSGRWVGEIGRAHV